MDVTFLGHSSLLIDSGDARVITDPVLSGRILHLRRHSAPVTADLGNLSAIVISHLHHDHFHASSLRRVAAGDPPTVIPRGGGKLARKAGLTEVHEIEVGETVALGESLTVEAVRADHRGGRPLGPEAEAVGYVLGLGGLRVYFAGDTDLHDEMGNLGDIDLALLPVWGWGTSIGAGHLDPERAAEAVAVIHPRLAIPIHWGTFLPVGTHRKHHNLLSDPPREFAEAARKLAPGSEVRIVEPGDTTALD